MLHDPLAAHKKESARSQGTAAMRPATPGRIRLRPADRILMACFLAVALAALGGSWFWIQFVPETASHLFACASMQLFGRPCPMCGLTRGLHAVWQGNLTAASEFNPLSLAVFIFLIAEAGFRTFMLLASCRPAAWKSIARTDVLVHAALVSAYLGYAIAWVSHQYML